MDNLSLAIRRIFIVVFGILAGVFIALLAGCATSAPQQPQQPQQPKQCAALVQEVMHAMNAAGYSLYSTQSETTGELAVFVPTDGTTAQLFYLTPVSTTADYLESKGWTRAAECADPRGAPATLLQRTVEIAPQGTPA